MVHHTIVESNSIPISINNEPGIKKHTNEKDNHPSLDGFNDKDVIIFYVYKKNTLIVDKDKNEKQKKNT